MNSNDTMSGEVWLSKPKSRDFKRPRENSFIVFTNNWPSSMTKAKSWQFVKFEGRVIDIYISWKTQETTTQLFAFVRFAIKEEP